MVVAQARRAGGCMAGGPSMPAHGSQVQTLAAPKYPWVHGRGCSSSRPAGRSDAVQRLESVEVVNPETSALGAR
eukprot:5300676-Alexandrium_andersonii.AAC.1